MSKYFYLFLCGCWFMFFFGAALMFPFWPTLLRELQITPTWDENALAGTAGMFLGTGGWLSGMVLAFCGIEGKVRWTETPEEREARLAARNKLERRLSENAAKFVNLDAQIAELQKNTVNRDEFASFWQEIPTAMLVDAHITHRLSEHWEKRPDAKLFADIDKRLCELEQGFCSHVVDGPAMASLEALDALRHRLVELERRFERDGLDPPLDLPPYVPGKPGFGVVDMQKFIEACQRGLAGRTP